LHIRSGGIDEQPEYGREEGKKEIKTTLKILGQHVCGSKMESCTCNYDFPSL